MLSLEALNAAFPLTELADNASMKIVPIPGTPLDRLVQATRSDDKFVTMQEDGSVMPSISDIEYIANCKDELLGGSPHDKAFDDVVDVTVAAVQGHVKFAKNVVKPAVEELVEATQQTLEALTPSSLLGMEVITFNPPLPLQNNALDTMARQFDNVPFDVPKLSMRCPDQTTAEIIELMKTGSSSLDRDIEAWAAALGETCILDVYQNVFQIKQAGLNDRAKTFRDYTDDRECGADHALIIFLLARRLIDEPLPSTEMDMRVYENLMAEYRNQAGARVYRAICELETITKTKTLVKSVVGGKTTVYGFVYDAWIKAGGANEILFGNTMTTPYAATVDMLNSRAEELKIKWNRHSASVKTVESNRRFLRIKEALAYNFEKQIREAGDEFYEEATIGNRETVIKRFREMLDDVSIDETQDLWNIALKLVCRSRFARTDAERILAGIERVIRENPEIDVREAAAVSLIDYIAYWVASQMKVEQAI